MSAMLKFYKRKVTTVNDPIKVTRENYDTLCGVDPKITESFDEYKTRIEARDLERYESEKTAIDIGGYIIRIYSHPFSSSENFEENRGEIESSEGFYGWVG